MFDFTDLKNLIEKHDNNWFEPTRSKKVSVFKFNDLNFKSLIFQCDKNNYVYRDVIFSSTQQYPIIIKIMANFREPNNQVIVEEIKNNCFIQI